MSLGSVTLYSGVKCRNRNVLSQWHVSRQCQRHTTRAHTVNISTAAYEPSKKKGRCQCITSRAWRFLRGVADEDVDKNSIISRQDHHDVLSRHYRSIMHTVALVAEGVAQRRAYSPSLSLSSLQSSLSSSSLFCTQVRLCRVYRLERFGHSKTDNSKIEQCRQILR